MTSRAPMAHPDVAILEVRSLVDGRWVTPSERIGVLSDPNTGRERQAQLSTELAEVDTALRAAERVHQSAALDDGPIAARIDVLTAFARALAERQEDIACQDAISTGNPITTTRLLASYLAGRVQSAVDQLEQLGEGRSLAADGRTVRLLNRSLGPVVVLAPWNAPTFVAVSKIGAAIAAGCPVILKPSEWAPGGAQIIAEVLDHIIAGSGLPRATFQLVHGGARVGAALSADPRVKVITFTGGVDAGRAVAAAAAPNLTLTQLELGSNNPAIVLPDADIARTARWLISGVTRLNGQWCEAPGKVLVSQSIHDALVEALIDEASRVAIGHCMADETRLGPLAFSTHRDRLRTQLASLSDAGAIVSSPASLPDLGGWFFSPTVVTGVDARSATTELFGPVLTVHPTTSTAEALSFANLPGGGLDAFVFGSDEDAALEVGARMRAGEVRINGTNMADLADGSEQSFWDGSGVGGHGPANAVPFYQGRRVVGVDSDTLPI